MAQFLVDLSKHLVKPGLYFMSKPNDIPCNMVYPSNLLLLLRGFCIRKVPLLLLVLLHTWLKCLSALFYSGIDGNQEG